jgi:hypothetical protein
MVPRLPGDVSQILGSLGNDKLLSQTFEITPKEVKITLRELPIDLR